MKSLIISLIVVISCYSFAGVLPLQAQQSPEGVDTDLVLVGVMI